MSEPELQYSSASGPFERADLSFEIQIYKNVEDPDWVLEILDERGTSHVFDDRFADDAKARACAIEAIEAGEVDPLPEEQESLLNAYTGLWHPDVAPGLRETPMYIFGALTAMHAAPSLLPFAEVFGAFLSGKPRSVEPAIEAVSDLHGMVGDCLEANSLRLSALTSHEDATQWALGYLSVVERDPVWTKEADAEDGEMLAAVVALAAADGTAVPEDPQTAEVGLLRQALEQSAAELYDRWRDIRRALAAEQGAATFRRETPKVGRNEPCPCGSGKKYKKCCLRG